MKQFITEDLIKSFQKVLLEHQFGAHSSFSEEFAIKRFLKKFQQPDDAVTNQLKAEAWSDWLQADLSIPTFANPTGFPELWRARLRKISKASIKNTLSFPNGSEMYGTRGYNSIESRLSRSTWSLTYEDFDDFSVVVYSNKCLKRAFRQRYLNWFQNQHDFDLSINQADKFIFNKMLTRYAFIIDSKERKSKAAYAAFQWKLQRIVKFSHGGRFSSVPKNNLVRRPIIIENFGSMVLQKSVGNHIRAELKTQFDIDLNSLQDKHRKMISCDKYATIDLKNASDMFHLSLVRWFFSYNSRLLSQIEKYRSSFVLGPDGDYHHIHKVSSMGNGFTFELMTWILTCVVRELDPEGSVYGDDIIISKDKAPRLIQLLERMGLVVNKDKSFIDGPFRESCGGNFHDEEGYMESYDFHWPTNIHDCVIAYNKCLRLSKIYPQFGILLSKLRRHIPKPLQGPIEDDFFSKEIHQRWDEDQTKSSLSGYFRCGTLNKSHRRLRSNLSKIYCYDPSEIGTFISFRFDEQLASPLWRSLRKRNWAKYEMYLYSNMVTKDVRSGTGCWVSEVHVYIGGSTVKYNRALYGALN